MKAFTLKTLLALLTIALISACSSTEGLRERIADQNSNSTFKIVGQVVTR